MHIFVSRYINVPSREEIETRLACDEHLPQVKHVLAHTPTQK